MQKRKRCPDCERKKVLNDFPNHRGMKDGKHTYCKLCTRSRNAKFRKEHSKEFRKSVEQSKLKLKIEVMTHYCNGIPHCMCEHCDITIIRFLTIDHIKGGGVKHRKKIGRGGQDTYTWLKRNGFPKGFRVLCYNCNCGRYGQTGKSVCAHAVDNSKAVGR